MSATVAKPHTHGASARRPYVLFMLVVIMAVTQLDRGLLNILLQDIKAEMQLSDTVLALISGSGYALVFSVASIPIARLADRLSRVRILGIGVMVYGIMASLLGLAQNPLQLAAARSGVALGEASANAPSAALISDLYPPEQRSKAISLWGMGTYIGLFAGLALGGYLNAQFGWRVAIWATALPGLLVGAVFLLTVRDPRSGASDGHAASTTPPFRDALVFLSRQPSYLLICAGVTSQGFLLYSFATWTPSLLMRTHEIGSAEVGLITGLTKGLCAAVGIVIGGYLAAYLSRRYLRRLVVLPIVGPIATAFFLLLFLLFDATTPAIVALVVASVFLTIHQAPALSMMQAVLPSHIQALATAFLFICIYVGGMALGPVVTGMFSDLFTANGGSDALRYALVVPAMFGPLSAAFFYFASRRFDADRARSEAQG